MNYNNMQEQGMKSEWYVDIETIEQIVLVLLTLSGLM